MERSCHAPVMGATIIFRPNPAPGEPVADIHYLAHDDVSLDQTRARLAQWAQALTVAVWKSRARQDREGVA